MKLQVHNIRQGCISQPGGDSGAYFVWLLLGAVRFSATQWVCPPCRARLQLHLSHRSLSSTQHRAASHASM